MNIFRRFYYFLTPTMRFWVRRILYFPYDFYTHIFGQNKTLVPPKGLIFVGSGDFVKQGNYQVELVKKYTNLKPDGKVLDIGCGIGRLAVPLTNYLNQNGVYEGFDIVDFGIEWCKKNISSRFPNFRFRCVDLKNDLYNLSTENEARNFEFPYQNNYFDSVVLTSVFTHMMPLDVEQYLKQISNVLNKNGKCLATFFIINEESKRNMLLKKTDFVFKYSYDGYYLMAKSVKEANIAYEEEFLFTMIDNCGLKIESVYYGSWSKKSATLDFQDIVILRKK